MEIVDIDHLKEGMVLAADVRDSNSRLLLTRGNTINSRHVRIFKIWGVNEILVMGASNDLTDAGADPELPDAGKLEEVRIRIRKLFQHLDQDNSTVRELIEAAVAYRAGPGGDEGNITPLPSSNRAEAQNISSKIQARILKTEIRLPEIPSFISDLNDVIASPTSSAGDIASVVNRSPSLATLLLKVVNSAFYGFPSRIDSISRAVTLIGGKEISGLALGISIMKVFKDIPRKIIDMQSFLRHSLCCATISRIIAAHRNMPQTEQLFLSGLLHDMGRLIIFKYFPLESFSLLVRARNEESPLINLEKPHLGYRHTDAAGLLLKNWNLPYNLEDCVMHHHFPSSARDPEKAAVVHMADIITNSLGIGSSGECLVPPFDVNLWKEMNFSLVNFRAVIRQAVHKMASLESIFDKGLIDL